jgi:hypothetical protein
VEVKSLKYKRENRYLKQDLKKWSGSNGTKATDGGNLSFKKNRIPVSSELVEI